MKRLQIGGPDVAVAGQRGVGEQHADQPAGDQVADDLSGQAGYWAASTETGPLSLRGRVGGVEDAGVGSVADSLFDELGVLDAAVAPPPAGEVAGVVGEALGCLDETVPAGPRAVAQAGYA
ncbi:hypothetical protein [Streptomyces griseoluteus]|uniref:hypothetical protein n=1 Tax=Streptomyces griseoluteus TaxID=29306 RepID=UPI0036FCB08F